MDVKQGKRSASRLSGLHPAPRILARGCQRVPAEVRAPATGLLAPPASAAGLLPAVRDLVSDEVRALTETLATLATLEGPVAPGGPLTRGQGFRPLRLRESRHLLEDQPLPDVLALVLGQGRAVPEALPAVVALIGPLLSVSPQVQEQAGGPREGLPAHAAGVGLLPGVRPPVAAQGGVLVEGAPAVLTLVGLLPGVDPPVDREVSAVAERLAALGALVGLVTRVDALVLDQGGVLAEGLPALLAHVRPLSRVDPLVHREVRVVVEGLPAVSTLVGFILSLAAHGLWPGNSRPRGFATVTAITQLLS